MSNKEFFLQKNIVVWIGALICCALWGSAFPCIKLGYEITQIATGDYGSQILFAGVRFSIAGILAVLIGSVLQRKVLYPTVKEIPKILWLSLLQTVVQYLFFYIGLAHTSGVKASIIEGMNVFIAMLVAAIIFHQEKITSRKIIGCFVGFLGVILVNLSGGGLDFSINIMGEGFILLSTVSYAFSSVYLKCFSKDSNPVMLSGCQFFIGGIIMILVGVSMGGKFTVFSANAVGMLLWLAFVSAVAYSLWGILLKYNPVSKVAVFGFMNPVFGVILSAILLGEGNSIGVGSIVSLVMVCAGIWIVLKE